MQITIKGEMSLSEIRQAFYETLNELEDQSALRYSNGATLYLNPTNGFGDAVIPHDKTGRAVTKVNSNGPYRSVADQLKI